jgi:hypothetical protein
MEPMMPNDPTRRSALSVALLAHANSGYDVDCWLAGDGQPHGSVRYDTDRAWFTIQGRPAALRELAEALLRRADRADLPHPVPSSRRGGGWLMWADSPDCPACASGWHSRCRWPEQADDGDGELVERCCDGLLIARRRRPLWTRGGVR